MTARPTQGLSSHPASGRVRRRSAVLFAVLAAVLAGALVAAFVSRRRVEGAVPGREPILSLAASEKGFLAGTSRGLWVSANGRDWVRHPKFAGGRVVVASSEGAFDDGGRVAPAPGREVAFAASSQSISRIDTSRTASPVAKIPAPPSAIALFEQGILVATGDGGIFFIQEPLEKDRPAVMLVSPSGGGPKEILALAVPRDGSFLMAGGLVSGLWRTFRVGRAPEEVQWERLVETPTTAILVDPSDSQRILLGTPGGILISEDGGRTWRFTEMRSSVAGISARDGRFFAMADRLVFSSAEGDTDWKAPAVR